MQRLRSDFFAHRLRKRLLCYESPTPKPQQVTQAWVPAWEAKTDKPRHFEAIERRAAAETAGEGVDRRGLEHETIFVERQRFHDERADYCWKCQGQEGNRPQQRDHQGWHEPQDFPLACFQGQGDRRRGSQRLKLQYRPQDGGRPGVWVPTNTRRVRCDPHVQPRTVINLPQRQQHHGLLPPANQEPEAEALAHQRGGAQARIADGQIAQPSV